MAKIDRAAKVQLLADFDAQYAAFVTAGMDEAGRGPLVGNVVAACVCGYALRKTEKKRFYLAHRQESCFLMFRREIQCFQGQ